MLCLVYGKFFWESQCWGAGARLCHLWERFMCLLKKTACVPLGLIIRNQVTTCQNYPLWGRLYQTHQDITSGRSSNPSSDGKGASRLNASGIRWQVWPEEAAQTAGHHTTIRQAPPQLTLMAGFLATSCKRRTKPVFGLWRVASACDWEWTSVMIQPPRADLEKQGERRGQWAELQEVCLGIHFVDREMSQG